MPHSLESLEKCQFFKKISENLEKSGENVEKKYKSRNYFWVNLGSQHPSDRMGVATKAWLLMREHTKVIPTDTAPSDREKSWKNQGILLFIFCSNIVHYVTIDSLCGKCNFPINRRANTTNSKVTGFILNLENLENLENRPFLQKVRENLE